MEAMVAIIMGSKSDMPYAEDTLAVLEELDIESEVRILSAHRTAAELEKYITAANERGIAVFITLAGHAAALPGVVAARTVAPVIGVPLPTSDLQGQDSLYAIAQMPPGIPVGTMAIGKPGARNAAWFAAAILGISDTAVAGAIAAGRARMAENVLADDAEAQQR